ncbi:DUF1360 domain-containing protein [Goodfellowiella coeruleoviolacea]|uniref:DUF1360 domain-containing protein n=1 Tax=Goodfellowiella coeruleoviolacea TaxID=334858 RepID=A0AAE3GE27_9PSEU|nr:DUF1360 domain-containing protein [Goodfellowiella coeruleoviolacea]MCP2166562.1 Protein of unknown function (DUF1360) [Goodfellowiella coeruleoviolacea]
MSGNGTGASGIEREAATYRGSADRPLGGYVLVMGVFAALVSAAVGLAAATGRRAPTRLRPLDLITLALGTHKLSRLVSKDAVTSPLRAPFTRYQGTGGPAEVMEEPRTSSPLRHALGELLTCPFCLDLWVATGFAVGMVFAPRVTRLVMGTFGALAGADFLQLAYARVQQAAE